jgi:hypothetical protein
MNKANQIIKDFTDGESLLNMSFEELTDIIGQMAQEIARLSND